MTRVTSRESGSLGLRPGARKPSLRGTVDAKRNASRGAKDRSALGEITNARGNNDNRKGFKSQVKKGLTNIVNRTRNSASSSSTKLETSDGIKQSASDLRDGQQLKAELPLSEETDDTIQKSQSLPSSQEEESMRLLKEKLTKSKTGSDVHVSSLDSDLCHSAGEEPHGEALFVARKSQRYLPPPRVLPPDGVPDFDMINAGDVASNSDYAADIFQYYKDRERLFFCPSYMNLQTEISEMMRAILVDWLVEVQESFELNHETLYTAVKLMDLYLSKVKVTREQLQLVGATACLVACKIDERIPPNLDDFVYVCDDAYSRKDIMAKEREMVEAVGYDVGYPLSYRFLRRFGRVCNVSMPELTLARYILEMSLMDYQFNVETSESRLAAAALVLSLKIRKIEGWQKTFEFYAQCTLREVEPLMQKLLKMMQLPACEHTKTIRLKYSHRVFHEVAHLPVPETIELA